MRIAQYGIALTLLAATGAAQSAVEREAKDRAAIEKLMWNYTRALDTENAEAYIAAFTPDGEFRAGGNATKGHDALKKMVSDLKKRSEEAAAKGEKRPAMYHVETNSYLEFVDADHAKLYAYWMTVFAGDAPNAPARIAAVGHEVNDIVKVGGKWLIKVRDVAPKE